MTIIIHPAPVPLRVDETGTIRVGSTRITLDVLTIAWLLGSLGYAAQILWRV